MKAVLSPITPNNGDLFTKLTIGLVSVIIALGLLTQSYFVYLHFSNGNETAKEISKQFDERFNGYYKSSPNNIFYEGMEDVYVESVKNNVRIGKLAGNRQLEFGLKNILEEYLQEKDYSINSASQNKINVEIIYLDVLTTKSNISVFHKSEEEVVIRLRGTLHQNGKKVKDVIVEESSAEISMSTLIVDEGGKFNQTSLSNALKKGCEKLITKLSAK